jgi:riboflavin kinase/FMN adenylyltransferase
MTVERELAALTPSRPALITVGAFDGIHLGHQALLKRLVGEAKRQELVSVVVTFRQHPLKLLSPRDAPPFIASLPENIRLIKNLGVDVVVTLTFNAELASIDAQTFVLLLQHYLKMKGLILGWDFAMGCHREGTLGILSDLGRRLGFTTEILPAVTVDGEIVSSTAIRKAVLAGSVTKAGAMLGRPFSIEGRVVTGAGRGTGLGCPTANLDTNPGQIIPAEGVYATVAWLNGNACPSVTSISRCPTFGGDERTVDVHLLDFEGDIYRRTLRIDIIERLRGVRRFESPKGLTDQIAKDIAQSRAILKPTVEKSYE